LTLPQGTGPFAAVVLIKGSGPLDRDETIFGHKPFWVLADALTRRGVAVLRVDGRGVGGSDRGPSTATSADFADDVAAGVDLLRRRPDIRPDMVGLIGHSEGAVIAPMVAAKDDGIAFLVLMAGLGIRGEDNTLAQMRAIRSAEGAAPDQIDKQQAMMAQVLSVVASAANEAAAQPEVLKLFADGGIPEQQAEKLALRWNNRWERFILPYRPDITLGKIHCPVLALNGSKDLQVPANLNLPAIKSALSKDSDVTVEELPGLNHLFQTADKGLPSEYGRIEETISPTALRLVTEWVVSHSR
jgi:pimeloyl-ACP methyl ester carboxylesterase